MYLFLLDGTSACLPVTITCQAWAREQIRLGKGKVKLEYLVEYSICRNRPNTNF